MANFYYNGVMEADSTTSAPSYHIQKLCNRMWRKIKNFFKSLFGIENNDPLKSWAKVSDKLSDDVMEMLIKEKNSTKAIPISEFKSDVDVRAFYKFYNSLYNVYRDTPGVFAERLKDYYMEHSVPKIAIQKIMKRFLLHDSMKSKEKNEYMEILTHIFIAMNINADSLLEAGHHETHETAEDFINGLGRKK